jgi:hypothetical protein
MQRRVPVLNASKPVEISTANHRSISYLVYQPGISAVLNNVSSSFMIMTLEEAI